MITTEGRHVWVDSTKGTKGTGTQSNPLPARMEGQFDEVLTKYKEHTTIHLKASIHPYVTKGYDHEEGGVTISSGCNIVGPRGAVVQLRTPPDVGNYSVIYSEAFTHGNILEGFTIDGGIREPQDVTVQAINVRGNRSELRDLWIMQCSHGMQNGTEGFPISIGDDGGPLISPVIEDCVYWGPYFGSKKSPSTQSTMFLMSANSGLGVHGGIMRRNKAYLTVTPNAFGNLFSISGAHGCEISDNVGWVNPDPENSWVGIHQDTLNASGLLVSRNHITSHVGFLFSNSSSWPSLSQKGPQIWRNIVVERNCFVIHDIPGKCYGGQFINAGGPETAANKFVGCCAMFNRVILPNSGIQGIIGNSLADISFNQEFITDGVK